MTNAAIYARVSSDRQRKDKTIDSQTAALRQYAAEAGWQVPADWIFEDAGHSGATLIRPGLERLRDLAAAAAVDVVLCYSPDRLARKFAYQALLVEEFTRAGTRVQFVRGPRGDSPEDQLLVQFQGMFAEYEKAQLMERYRRGKTYQARAGSVSVLSGAPFGYRYHPKSSTEPARYQIEPAQAALVRQLFDRYTDQGASIADLARWLSATGTPTRTGKTHWDPSVVWGMLRNPAYAGTAAYGKTMQVHQSPGRNRRARLQGRSTPSPVKAVNRPTDQQITIPVPAIITRAQFERAATRLADNKRYAARNSTVPSLLRGLIACATCGYAYYRASSRSAHSTLYYYRCLGSDNYRYPTGRVCTNRPIRADYLDKLVWEHISRLLNDPNLIHAELERRLEQARTADPTRRQREDLTHDLDQATSAVNRLIQAYTEHLITIDELRERVPDLRARQTSLHTQINDLDAQLVDRAAYLALANDLDGFLSQLRHRTQTSTVTERQQVLRLLVKDILIEPGKITIRHRIPLPRQTSTDPASSPREESADCPLRLGRRHPTSRSPQSCRPIRRPSGSRWLDPIVGQARRHR